jgi:hypothetical protein
MAKISYEEFRLIKKGLTAMRQQAVAAVSRGELSGFALLSIEGALDIELAEAKKNIQPYFRRKETPVPSAPPEPPFIPPFTSECYRNGSVLPQIPKVRK